MTGSFDYLPSPNRLIVSSALLATAVSASALALTAVVTPGAWRTEVVALVLLVTAVTLLLRLGLRGWRGPDVGTFTALVPTLVAAVFSAWLVVARFSGTTLDSDEPGAFDPAVSRADVSAMAALFGAMPGLLNSRAAPIEPSEPVVMLIVVGALGVLLLADIVIAVRVPALAGVAVALLWLPPLLIVQDMPLVPVVVTGLALLGLLAADDPHAIERRYPGPRADRWTRDRARAVRTYGPRVVRWGSLTALTVVAALSLGSALPHVPGWGSIEAPDVRTGVGQVGENLDLTRSLGERSQRKVFSYTTSSPTTRGPLRTGTLYEFDGRTWTPPASRAEAVADGTVLWPGTYTGSLLAPVTLTLRTEEMRGTVLPVPLDPRAVARPGSSNAYDPQRDVVETSPDLSSGDQAEVVFHPRDLSADVLRATDTPRTPADVPEGDRAAIETAYAVAETPGADELAAMATTIVGEAATDYDRAVALQDFLRTDPRFRYTLEVPSQSSRDAVLDFLADGRGYCVQFATAMVSMARSLGMPARLAVGYLPGRSESDRYVVRGRDAHAWPEIYFVGAGWVRFEPTPGTQSGIAPAYTQPEPAQTDAPTTEPTAATPTLTRSPTVRPTGPTATAQVPGSVDDGGVSPWMLGGIATLALLVVAGAVAVLRRRASGHRDLEAAWRTVLRAARKGDLEPGTGETLRAFAARVDPRGGAVTDLARAVERARYAPGSPTPAAHEVERLQREALAELGRDRVTEKRSGTSTPDGSIKHG
ncbi:transglutaminase TgpA family protein [Sanguibacter sp. A247]|uniref:transglutaminase TgpA family protein n=1 Tax=unclassified Sanguibacter TaxID=2645534 RepID=UPI003FD6E82A